MANDASEFSPDDMTYGRIPWSVDEFDVVNAYNRRLGDTAPDDWDFHPRELWPAALQEAPWPMKKGRADQLFLFLVHRYHNPQLALVCLWRWRQMGKFLQEHMDRLVREGFIHEVSEHHPVLGPGRDIEVELTHVLCVLPFSGFREVQGRTEPTFDLDEVIRRTRALIMIRG